jgi:uncharacterized metal-binding protein
MNDVLLTLRGINFVNFIGTIEVVRHVNGLIKLNLFELLGLVSWFFQISFNLYKLNVFNHSNLRLVEHALVDILVAIDLITAADLIAFMQQNLNRLGTFRLPSAWKVLIHLLQYVLIVKLEL